MSRLMPVACVVVGLGLALGCGSVVVDAVLDYSISQSTDSGHRGSATGVPALYRTVEGAPGSAPPDGLAWPGIDWQKWPAHRAVIVWTWSGPKNSRTEGSTRVIEEIACPE